MYASEQGVLNGQYNAAELACRAEEQRARPSVLMKPKLSREGDQWCALYGDNLVTGLVGFGITPEDAMKDFDTNWNKEI